MTDWEQTRERIESVLNLAPGWIEISPEDRADIRAALARIDELELLVSGKTFFCEACARKAALDELAQQAQSLGMYED